MHRRNWNPQAIAKQLPEGAVTLLRDPTTADVESPLVRLLYKLAMFRLDGDYCLVDPLQLSPFGRRVLLYLDNRP